ncbi:MAG: hypothetical protein AABO41_13615 [Acidobacteriota bacterium]
MKTVFRVLCTVVFLVGLLVFSLAQANQHTQTGSTAPDDLEPSQPFVVSMVQYRVGQDGTRTVMTRSTIYLKADGESRNVCSGADGRLTIYATLHDGVYTKAAGSNSLTYVSPRATEEMSWFYRSAKSLRNNPNYARTEGIVGLKAYVQRHVIDNPESNIEWIEDSYSPRTGRCGLRMRLHFRDGTEVLQEAEQVEFEEVPNNLNADLKDLQISNLEEKRRKQSQK